MRHALADRRSGRRESEGLADNRPSALGERSERNAKPAFILSAMGDRILYRCLLSAWLRASWLEKGSEVLFWRMTVTCANPRTLSHFLAQFHIRCLE
jgi:hypothetical protein